MKSKTSNNKSHGLPISIKILLAFLFICIGLSVISGSIYYNYSKKVVLRSIRNHAQLLCNHIEHKFETSYSEHIEQKLNLFVMAPQLDNYLRSTKEEASMYRAEVEILFLNQSQECEKSLSTTFLDSQGDEKIGVYGNKRKRTYKRLEEIAQDGALGQYTRELFTELKSDATKILVHSDPFYDEQNRLGILVGIRKQEPEAGGFGGVIIQHCDLTEFIRDISESKVLNTPVMWVYKKNGENLLSPPEGHARKNPKPYLTGEKKLAGSNIYIAHCRLFDSENTLMTVLCSVPDKAISKELSPIIWSVMTVFSGLLIVSLISSSLISVWISKPIKKLTKITKGISKGSLDIELDSQLLKSGNEIGVLANSFKKMTVDLKKSTTSIDNLNREISERKRAEGQLTKLLSLHTATLEATADGILVVDLHGKIITYNQKFLELWDIPDSTAQTKDDDKLLEQAMKQLKEPQAFLAEVHRLYSNPEEQSFDMVEFKDGRVLERLSKPQKLEDVVLGRVWSFRDVTERKKAEQMLKESEEKFRKQFEGALDAIFLADIETGILIDCNPAATRLLGKEKSELIGKHQRTLHPEVESKGKCSETFRKHVEEKSEQILETKVITKKGEIKDVAIRANVIEIQGKKVLQGIFRDITENKKAEKQQEYLLKQLEDTNNELKEFAYIVSHDLKAPLRGIRSIVTWIAEDYADKLDNDGKKQIDMLVNRTDRMQQLIDGILQYSRVGRVSDETTQVDLNKVLPEIIDLLAPPENISITIENELPVIECEQTRISQVFQNLLSNAVKFTDKPSDTIKVGCVEENGYWKFSVSDNGPGIDEKHHEIIFKVFQTLNRRDDVEGTGIGLSVVKKIISLYNGKIWVESKLGEGSTFYFTLPQTLKSAKPVEKTVTSNT